MRRLQYFIILLIILGLNINISATFTKKTILMKSFPLTSVKSDSNIYFSWYPIINDNGDTLDANVVFAFGRNPGAEIPQNYTYKIGSDYFTYVNGYPSISFIPETITDENGNYIMQAGVFYYTLYVYDINGSDTTLYTSPETQLIVESKYPVKMLYPISSGDNPIEESAPVFRWEANPGVPYYHLILSDKPIEINTDSGTVSGISAIWQVITPNTSIQYGEPDPSGYFSDITPPPLSPGVTYNWIVLNNYGNNPATSSTVASAPVSFVIRTNSQLVSPVNLYPTQGDSFNYVDDTTIVFRWTNGGKDAIKYELYIFVYDTINGVEAAINVWNTVTTDTFFILNTHDALYKGKFLWKVYAVDDQGFSKVSDPTWFYYNAKMATLSIKTYGIINDTTLPLAFVSIDLIPLSGSSDIIPIVTDNNGGYKRVFLLGKYKLVANKDGYKSETKYVDLLKEDSTYYVSFVLEKAAGRVIGKVVNKEDSLPISEVNVIATNVNGEKSETQTDKSGYFVLDIPEEGSWVINIEKTGYISPSPRNITIQQGDILDLGSIPIEKAPYRIYGIIKNEDGYPISRATIEIINLITNEVYDEVITGDDGTYSFYVPYGSWRVYVNTAGFIPEYKDIENLGYDNEVNFVLKVGGLISGVIYRVNYNVETGEFDPPAPIQREANIIAYNIETQEEFKTSPDVYGKYSLGVSYGRYILKAEGPNYIDYIYPDTITITETNRSFTQNIYLRSYGDIVSYTFDTLNNPIEGAYISSFKDNKFIKGVYTDQDGKGFLEDLEDGSYTIFAAKKMYITSIKKTITIDSGVVDSVLHFNIIRGPYRSLNVKVLYNGNDYTEGFLNLISPYPDKAILLDNNYYNIDSLTTDIYYFKYIPENSNIIGIYQGSFDLTSTTQENILDTIYLPFTCLYDDTLALYNGNSIIFKIYNSSPSLNITGKVFYRYKGEDEYKELSLNKNPTGDTLYATLNNVITDNLLEYYYEIATSDGNIYSNIDYPYYSYIPKKIKLEYAKFKPAVVEPPDKKIVLKDYPIYLTVEGYYRGQVFSNLISKIEWFSSDTSILSMNKSTTREGEFITLYPKKVASSVSIRAVVYGTSGERDTLLAYFNIIEGEIDSAYILRKDKKVDDRMVANNEEAIFVVMGKVKTDSGIVYLDLPAIWSIYPKSGGEIEAGYLTIKKNFVGQMRVIATVKNYKTLYYNESPSTRYANRFLHVYAPIVEPDTVSDYRGLTIIVNDSSLINSTTDKFFLSYTLMSNYQKQVDTMEVVSNIYNLYMEQNNIFNKPLTLIYKIPEELRSRKNFMLGYYVDSLMKFVFIEKLKRVNDSIVVGSIKHFSTYAIFTEKEPVSIKNVQFVPNPFSPYVWARDNNRESPGLAIKFYASVLHDPVPNIKIEIYTITGVKVWEKEVENAENGYQTVYWDGKTLNGKMARNGRYIVKIKVWETTGAEAVYKGLVVLIK